MQQLRRFGSREMWPMPGPKVRSRDNQIVKFGAGGQITAVQRVIVREALQSQKDRRRT